MDCFHENKKRMKGIIIQYGMFAKNKVMTVQSKSNKSWIFFTLSYAGITFCLKFWLELPWIWKKREGPALRIAKY